MASHQRSCRDFGPAHPEFWAGKWRPGPSFPTFENFAVDSPYGYSYKHPYWGKNYFFTPKRPSRWGDISNYKTPFLWSRYYRPWNY